jgi:hypothetical protein
MRTMPLAAILVLAFSIPSHAAEKPRPAQGTPTQAKKIWTNEDLDQLRSRGLISIVGPEVSAANESTSSTATAPSEPSFPVYNSRLDDPGWYAQQAVDLQAELDKREAALQQEQMALANAADGITQPGVAMDKPTIGVTPDAALAILEAQVNDVQSQLDELGDLARQHDIEPGVLRS